MGNEEKKDLENVSLLGLLVAIGNEEDGDKWLELYESIITKPPFSCLEERQNELSDQIDELEKEVRKLKDLVKRHEHLHGNVVAKI